MLVIEPKTHKPARKPFYKSNKLLWIIPSIVVGLCLLLYLGVSVYAANIFNQVPNRPLEFSNTPAQHGLSYQEVSFPSALNDGITLRGWWIPNPSSDRAIIIVHGKAQTRMEMVDYSKNFWEMGYNLLLFDLRGHGKSDGDHYYFGQKESWDTVGAFNFVKSKGFTSEHIGLYGRSMGAATALLAAGHDGEIKTIFSDSSFANFEEVASERMPVEKGLPSFFLPGIFTAGRILLDFKVDEIRPGVVLPNLKDVHIFLVHCEGDSTIPVAQFYQLKKAGGSKIVEIWLISGGEHTKGLEMYPALYLQKVKTFFDTYLGQ
ncbi:MAG TPA: alpha/beta fold hydrolase [Chloroflexia bacterium]|nr:alpha/beta fold hydrolase [Chloroflexia bacterium]